MRGGVIVPGEKQALHVRVEGLDLRQFKWTVVDEHDAIRTDIPGFEDTADRGRLRVPMRLDGDKPLAGQKDVFPCEGALNSGWVVLARYTQQHAGFGQGPQKLLVNSVDLMVTCEIPGQVFGADFTGDAVPQRVVQVGDQSFFGRGRVNQAGGEEAAR